MIRFDGPKEWFETLVDHCAPLRLLYLTVDATVSTRVIELQGQRWSRHLGSVRSVVCTRIPEVYGQLYVKRLNRIPVFAADGQPESVFIEGKIVLCRRYDSDNLAMFVLPVGSE